MKLSQVHFFPLWGYPVSLASFTEKTIFSPKQTLWHFAASQVVRVGGLMYWLKYVHKSFEKADSVVPPLDPEAGWGGASVAPSWIKWSASDLGASGGLIWDTGFGSFGPPFQESAPWGRCVETPGILHHQQVYPNLAPHVWVRTASHGPQLQPPPAYGHREPQTVAGSWAHLTPIFVNKINDCYCFKPRLGWFITQQQITRTVYVCIPWSCSLVFLLTDTVSSIPAAV